MPAPVTSAADRSTRCAIATSGLSGMRAPRSRYGKSTRSHGSGATARSMATSVRWFRSAPAPGVSSSAPALPISVRIRIPIRHGYHTN